MAHVISPPPYAVLVITSDAYDVNWLRHLVLGDAVDEPRERATPRDEYVGPSNGGADLRTSAFDFYVRPTPQEAETLLRQLNTDVIVLLFRSSNQTTIGTLARLSRLPIVEVGEREGPRAAQQAVQAGATDYLTYTATDSDVLEGSLRMALERGRHARRGRRTTERTREREQLLGRVISGTQAGLALLDIKGRVAFVNEAAAHLLDAEVTALEGQLWPHEVVVGEVAEYVVHRCSGETAVLQVRARSTPGLGGTVVTLSDVSPSRWLPIAYADAVETMERRSAELDRYTINLQHDLAAPARGVRTYLQLLEKKAADSLDEDASDLLRGALSSSLTLRDMLRDLRAYAGASQGGKPSMLKPVAMQGVLTDTLAALKPELDEAGAEVQAAHMPTVLAEAEPLRRVWLNLLSNAIKFRADEPLRIEIEVTEAEDEWVLSVRDNGKGIATNDLSRIFLPFERAHADPKVTGSGLGLPMSQRIIERFGGRMWAVATLGRGTTILFTLPRRT